MSRLLIFLFPLLIALASLQQAVVGQPAPLPLEDPYKIGPDPTPCPGQKTVQFFPSYYDVSGARGLSGMRSKITFFFNEGRLDVPSGENFIRCDEVGALYGYRMDPPVSAPNLFRPFYGYLPCKDCCEVECDEWILIPVDGEAAGMPLPESVATGTDVLQFIVLRTWVADSLSTPSRVARLRDYSYLIESAGDHMLANLSSPSGIKFSWMREDLYFSDCSCYVDPGLVFLKTGASYPSDSALRTIRLDDLPLRLHFTYGDSADSLTTISLVTAPNRSVRFQVPIASPHALLASELNPLPPLALPRDAYILETSMEALLAGEATATPDLYRQMDLNGDDAVTTCDLLLLRGESCPTPTPTPSPTVAPRPDGWVLGASTFVEGRVTRD